MKKLLIIGVLITMFTNTAKAEIGVNAGLGLPFVTQYGLNLTMGPNWTMDLMYNNLNVSTGSATADLTMPELSVKYHPWGGSFFLGVGVGQETITSESSSDGVTVKGELTTTTTIAKLGWMWGKANGDFWFGMDLAYIVPSGGDADITVNGGVPDSEDVQDVNDSIEQFGELSSTNFIF